MSSNQLPHQPQSHPSTAHQIPSNTNITLGPEQTERKSFPNPNTAHSFSQNYAIQLELKNISREVSRIADKTQKGRYVSQNSRMTTSLPLYQDFHSTNQLQKDLSTMLNLKTNTSTLSKYNYYGRQYRFSTQNPSQTSQKPLDVSPQDQELKSFSPTSKYQPKKQELEMPDTQSYYIYFDQAKREKQLNLKVNKIQSQHQVAQNKSSSQVKSKSALYGSLNFGKTINQSHLEYDYDDEARTPPVQIFSKQEPESKWLLEKKVKKLQKELHMIKKKEQQRQKLRNFVSNNPKKDSKVYVGKQVDQLINSLWP